jgi:aspartyl-tRNA(Asn)/glutamyl-tRNA(Gln) amidotransferase subunit A
VPALSIPCGFDNQGMPLGMQIASPWFDEAMVLRLGHAFQKITDHHLRTPPIV